MFNMRTRNVPSRTIQGIVISETTVVEVDLPYTNEECTLVCYIQKGKVIHGMIVPRDYKEKLRGHRFKHHRFSRHQEEVV
jgi:hypothetical protein